MTLIESTARMSLPAAILFSVTAAWATEPSQPTSEQPMPAATNVGSAPAASASAPAPAPAADVAPQAPPSSPAVAPAAPPPNAVESSPYGSANDAPQANPAPRPPKQDVPATLFDVASDYAIGGLGGVMVMYTRFAGHDKPLVCGEGAVIIDHKFTLGGGGCGIPALMKAEQYGPAPNSDDRMSFGYGGAIIRYHFFSREAVNLGVGALVGAGGLAIGTWNGEGDVDNSDNYTNKSSDAVFVAEPQVGGYANLTRWLRVGIVGGYRFVAGVDTRGMKDSDFMGPTLGGTIQGGWF